MQVSITLTDEQLLQVSKDMQAAMPAIIAQAVPELVKHLLTEAGDAEERAAHTSKMPPGMDHWDRKKWAESYVTLRQAVINTLVEPAKEVFAQHPELHNLAQVMAHFVISNKREVMAEGFERFFSRMWSSMSSQAAYGAVMSERLAETLRTKQFLTEGESAELRGFAKAVSDNPATRML